MLPDQSCVCGKLRSMEASTSEGDDLKGVFEQDKAGNPGSPRFSATPRWAEERLKSDRVAQE